MTGYFTQVTGAANPQLEPEWVDEVLLAGAADDVCLHLGAPVSRGELGRLVAERRRALADAGLRRGGSVALCLPPSLAFIANLLACWQIGAQASLLDHRLTAFEVDVALQRLAPQVLVTVGSSAAGGPAAGLQRGRRAGGRLPGPAGHHQPRGHPAQLRVHRPLQDHRPRRRQPGRGGQALHADRRGSPRRRAHRVARLDGPRARAGRRPALQPARGRAADDPGPDDRGRHPVRRRRRRAADHAARRPLPHRAARLGAAAAAAAAADRHDHRRRADPPRRLRRVRRPVRRAAGQHVRDDRGRGHRHRPVRPAPARRAARSRHHLPRAGRRTAPRAARLAVPRRAGSGAAGRAAGCIPGTRAPSIRRPGWCGSSAAGTPRSRSAA